MVCSEGMSASEVNRAIDAVWRIESAKVRRRLEGGWTPEEAISTPSHQCGGGTRKGLEAYGKTKSLAEWVRDPRCRVGYMALWSRVNKFGWEAERAISTAASMSQAV